MRRRTRAAPSGTTRWPTACGAPTGSSATTTIPRPRRGPGAPKSGGGPFGPPRMPDGVWRTDWLISHYENPEAEARPERARERLKKLLGPGTPFELVWVGPWRFRRRVLERLTHGRVFFLGDAAAQHSPFGARGGNRAMQDASNLGWKLALVLQGRARPGLLETYELARHFAAREAVEIASRSAVFISPETDGRSGE